MCEVTTSNEQADQASVASDCAFDPELEPSDCASDPELEPSDAPADMGLGTGHFGDVALNLTFSQKRKKGKLRQLQPEAVPQLAGPLVDTHAHLEMLQNPPARLARCAYHGIKFICVMTDPAEDPNTTFDMLETWSDQAKELLRKAGLEEYADRIPHMRIASGVHPHNAKKYTPEVEDALLSRLHDPRTCAVGEVGLDYHYDLSPRDDQRRVFRRQIQIAKEAGIPLILHLREAHDEGFEILQEEGFPAAGTLLHCFNLDSGVLAPWVDAGCYIAYGGPLTFKKSDDVRESVAHVPLDRLLTETDSPYMTPEPVRGMECGPDHVVFTAAKLCEVVCGEGVGEGEGSDAGIVKGTSEGAASPTALDQKTLLDQVYRNAVGLLDRKPTAWQLGKGARS